ncbi:MAG: hypothetical protein KAQ99_02735 [Candidatus Aureabacteria bacterium]|nr:hypothetical protein [Candidatus Auribacterota bacterium]MCK5160469.1 hypothetical protein [Candidatus Auribacterota bacterium]
MDKPKEEKEVKKEPAIELPDVEQIIGAGKNKQKEKPSEKPNIQGVPRLNVNNKKSEEKDKEIPRLSKIPGSYTKPPEIAEAVKESKVDKKPEQTPVQPIPEKEPAPVESPEKETPGRQNFKFKEPSAPLKLAKSQQEILTKTQEQEEEKPGSLYGIMTAISLTAMAFCSYLIAIQYFGMEAPRFVRTILDLIYKVTS